MDFFVIGDPEVVIGFRFAGIEGIPVYGGPEALEAFRQALARKPTILALTSDVADALEGEIVEHQMGGDFPLIVDLPPLTGAVPGRKTLLESIREAIGIHV